MEATTTTTTTMTKTDFERSGKLTTRDFTSSRKQQSESLRVFETTFAKNTIRFAPRMKRSNLLCIYAPDLDL